MSEPEDAPFSQPPPARGGEDQSPSLPLPLREGVGERGWRELCRLEDIPDGASKGFPPPSGPDTGSSVRWQAGLFAVREGDAVFVYVNSCPHIGTPLDFMRDRFLSADGSRIVCATHGAEFGIADGECVRGPCFGDRLEPVMIQIKDGIITVPEDAGL